MADPSAGCCSRCCSIIFTLGLTALSMWLSLRTSNPKCTIHSFYLPALNRTINDTKNTTLFVALRLKNTNGGKGVYYDAVNRTFWLLPNATSMPVATSAVPRFYQGHKKTATKNVVVGPQERLNWTAVSSGVHPNGSVSFRVDLATAVRFKIMFWKTKRHRLNVGADVLVNASGGKVVEKDIKLSAAPDHHLIGFFSGQVPPLSLLTSEDGIQGFATCSRLLVGGELKYPKFFAPTVGAVCGKLTKSRLEKPWNRPRIEKNSYTPTFQFHELNENHCSGIL